MLFSFNSCVEDDSNLPSTAGWSRLDPASIPLRHRMIQANRGNLVKNPSFEHGRIINIDSNTVSNNITGWTWIGSNVDWVAEVHSGVYAVKIQRKSADETMGQGEGVISDFIRIIPGNYEFTFWIRLQDIHSYQERRGTRIDDAIDIRVIFYDKNRLLISGNTFNSQRNANIDQSFKALPFAGFWNIDNMDWSHVRGRTTNDYLTDGDVPDEAKFVKIFFGLKGTGTMWIDDVDFRYSNRNFTSLEKSEPYFDTTFSAVDMLVPAPKEAVGLDPLVYHYPGTDSLPYPVIVIPQHASRQTSAAAQLLKARLDMLFERVYGVEYKSKVIITSGIPARVVEDGGLVFNIGKNQLSGRQVSGHVQGYIIQPDSLYPNLVHLIGSDAEGNFYAAVTVAQLLDESRYVYYQSRIVDYPDIPQRSFLVSAVSASSDEKAYGDNLADMLMLKMNRGYLDYYRSRNMWERTGTAYLRGLSEIGREAHKHGMIQLAQMVNPYAFLPASTRLDSIDPGLQNRWMHSSSSSLSRLRARFIAGLEAGATTLVLCTNDHLPYKGGHSLNFSLYAERDLKRYINLQQAHIELIQLLTGSTGIGRPVNFEFIPPWYANELVDQSRGQGEQYLRDLADNIPDQVSILWSGPSKQSYSVDEADFHRYRALTDRELVLWDNSLNTLPDILSDTSLSMSLSLKLRTLNVFEPYQVKFTGSSLPGSQAGKIIINSPLDSELMKIRIATAADYMWNTLTYDPDLSLWKVLVSRYGREAAMNLYQFNESYMTLLGSLTALKNGTGNQRHTRQINDELEVMQETLAILDGLIPYNPRLLNELKSLKMELEHTFEKEMKAISTQVIADLDSI
ncbi:MAG: beta-N-acetylglucosaminidase domain-containing protein [Bacteroidales bacterium]|nr:beta-N-acetylglucosaminidase domain-containing protein [Bacteroidales bacterium]